MFFYISFSTPLKESRLDFSSPKQIFVETQLLETDCGRSLFLEISCAKLIGRKMLVALAPRNLESWYLLFPRLNFMKFYLAVLLQIVVLSLALISVSLYSSDIIFAVRSRKWLCRMDMKPPFLQLILCWILNLLPQGQNVGRLLISLPYRSLIESWNYCLDNSNPNSVTGTAVNQFKTWVWNSNFLSFTIRSVFSVNCC